MATDIELLERWRAGDREAGQRLFRRYFNAVERFFQNKLSEDVRDLVQQTFAACVEGRDRIKATSSFRSYLFAVAKNQLHTHLRQRYGRGHTMDLDELSMKELDPGPGPNTQISLRREQRLLLEALRSIPVGHQMLLEMRYWEQMKTREIADVLDIPHATVRTRVRRAHELLEQAIGQLAASPDELESTLANLDGWAEKCRQQLANDPISAMRAADRDG